MSIRAILGMAVAVCAVAIGWAGSALAAEEGEKIVIKRNGGAFPPGVFELRRDFKNETERTVNDGPAQSSQMKHRFDFVLNVKEGQGTGAGRDVEATLRRVYIHIHLAGEQAMEYDSDKPGPGGELEKQFKHIVGLTARSRFFGTSIKPFTGLNVGWDKYGQGNADFAPVVEMNKHNYGDAWLDRVFQEEVWQYLPPRPAGQDRLELTVGQAWTYTLKRPGVGRQPTDVEHSAKLEAIKTQSGITAALVKITWKINGMVPEMATGELRAMRGADEKGELSLAIHPASGMLLGEHLTVTRTDQVALPRGDGTKQRQGPSQTTVSFVETSGFEINFQGANPAVVTPVAPPAQPKTPAEVAAAFVAAWKAKDLKGMGKYGTSDNREMMKKIEGADPDDPTYQRVFGGQSGQILQVCDGKTGQTRYRSAKVALVELTTRPPSEETAAVMEMKQEDGAWCVEDTRVLTREEFGKLSAQPPGAADAGAPSVGVGPGVNPVSSPATPAEVAKAFLTAYKGDDRAAMSRLGSPGVRSAIEGKAPDGHKFSPLFAAKVWESRFPEWFRKVMQGWDGKIGQVRYPDAKTALVEFAVDPGGASSVAVLLLQWNEGKWVFDDFVTRDKDQFEKMPAQRPQAQPQGTGPDSASSRTPQPPGTQVEIVRDFSALAPGDYQAISGWERQDTWQYGAKPPRIQVQRAKVYFDMKCQPPSKDGRTPGSAEWIIRRVTMDQVQDEETLGADGAILPGQKRRTATYDSAAGLSGRDPQLERRLGYLVGTVARARFPNPWGLQFQGDLRTCIESRSPAEWKKDDLLLFSEHVLLMEPLNQSSKFLRLNWLDGLPQWANEPLPMANDPSQHKFQIGKPWEVGRFMAVDGGRTYRCELTGLRDSMAVVTVAWDDKYPSEKLEENLRKGLHQESGRGTYLYDRVSGLPMGADVSVWTTVLPKEPQGPGDPVRFTRMRRMTLSIAPKSPSPNRPAGDVEYSKADVTYVDDKLAVVRGDFALSAPHRWFTVTFQVWSGEDKILQYAGEGGQAQDFIQTWGDIFTTDQGGRYRDVRVGLPVERFKAALGLPKGKTTPVFVTCEVMETDTKKYLGKGWPARCALGLTTDADGKVIKIEAMHP